MGEPTSAPDAQVSTEIDGRILTGVGGPPEALDALTERYETPADEAAPSGTAVAQPAEGASPASPEPKRSRGQQRFADLTRERDAANAKAEAAERRAAELEARAQQPTPPPTPQQAAPQAAPPAQPATPAPTRPKPSVDHVGTTYQTYEDFTEDLADWKTEQRLASDLDTRIGARISAERAAQDFFSTVERSRAAAKQLYPDFETLLASGPGALVPLGPTPQEAMQRATYVIQHPQSAHIQYAILKDGDLAKRLQQTDPIAFGAEIAKLVPNGNGHSPAHPAPPPPAPFQPVGTGSRTTTPSSAELVKSYDFDASGYRERRAAERGVKVRRR
jgi:hypothetical protein